jgi:PAS domain-containing protein
VKEEVVGKTLVQLVVPAERRDFHLKLVDNIINHQEPTMNKRIEAKGIRKDGTLFPIELSVTAVKIKDKTCMLSIVRDVSEHKQLIDEVKQKQDILEAVTENIGAGLLLINKNYQILWANKYLEQNGKLTGKKCYSSFTKSESLLILWR